MSTSPLISKEAAVIELAATTVPETSKLALTSTNVALSSISSVALISSTVALGAPMF